MMIDLAQHYNEGFIALKDISARQNISKKYLYGITLQDVISRTPDNCEYHI